MPDRTLNMVEQGNLLTSIRRDICRIHLQLQRLLKHLDLPQVTDEEVDAALAGKPDLDTRTGASPVNLPGLKAAPPLDDEGSENNDP